LRRADQVADPHNPHARIPRTGAGDVGRAAFRGPPGQIDFAVHPWIVSNEKLKRETGWSPRYTSRETFQITMRAHGKFPPEDPQAGERAGATLQNA
jgi:nucleoside-diphosphate-sugar epimerase